MITVKGAMAVPRRRQLRVAGAYRLHERLTVQFDRCRTIYNTVIWTFENLALGGLSWIAHNGSALAMVVTRMRPPRRDC